MFLLHLLILLHQRRIGKARLLFHLRSFLWFRCDGVRYRRLDSVGIIQLQIQTQVQCLIECLAQIHSYAIDTAVVVVNDSRFAILVCTHLGVGAYNILRKCLKELVARHFRTSVNDRLNEKFFIRRQRLLFGMLLENN